MKQRDVSIKYEDYTHSFQRYIENLSRLETALEQNTDYSAVLLESHQLQHAYEIRLKEAVDDFIGSIEKIEEFLRESELRHQVSESLSGKDYPKIVLLIEYMRMHTYPLNVDILVTIFNGLKDELNYKNHLSNLNLPAFIHEPIISILYSANIKSLHVLPIVNTMIDSAQGVEDSNELINYAAKSLHLVPLCEEGIPIIKKASNSTHIELRDEAKQILNSFKH